MLIRKLETTLIVIGALAASILSAHDAKFHKGTPTQGEITSVAADRFELKTAKGALTVTFTKDTKFEHGDQAVDKGHFKMGDKVTVFGTKLPSGELVAKEIVMGAAPDHHSEHSGSDHSAH